MKMKPYSPMPLAGLIGIEEKADMMFSIKVAVTMRRARDLGKLARGNKQ